MMQPPQNPAGEFLAEENISPERRAELIAVIEKAPANLRKAVADLSKEQLNTCYRNWSIRQIVHHLHHFSHGAKNKFLPSLRHRQFVKVREVKPFSRTPENEFCGNHFCVRRVVPFLQHHVRTIAIAWNDFVGLVPG